MKIRTMKISADAVKASGNAWGREAPELIIEEYGEGGVVKRVSVQVRPIDIEELGRVLWELRGKYENALNSMTRALKGE